MERRKSGVVVREEKKGTTLVAGKKASSLSKDLRKVL